jgi:hypothetical protein
MPPGLILSDSITTHLGGYALSIGRRTSKLVLTEGPEPPSLSVRPQFPKSKFGIDIPEVGDTEEGPGISESREFLVLGCRRNQGEERKNGQSETGRTTEAGRHFTTAELNSVAMACTALRSTLPHPREGIAVTLQK